MKTLKFGVEIEFTGITKSMARKVIAEHFGTQINYYNYIYDQQNRKWCIKGDGSIAAESSTGQFDEDSSEYRCEMVTPILNYEDIPTLQEIVRKLRECGAKANKSCGVHVHVDDRPFTAKSLRNLVNIMASKEDLIFKAVGVRENREYYCKKMEQRFVEGINQSKPTSTEKIKQIWYDGTIVRHSTRYHALNLHSIWEGTGIEFRCFNGTMHAGKIKTYIQLCLAICHQALTQNGASARKTATTNEKYTFRTWLLRLGMIGEEFETARKFLLENLDGDIAFRNGRPDRAA